MITRGVEISMAGGRGEMVHGPTPWSFFSSFFFFFSFYFILYHVFLVKV